MAGRKSQAKAARDRAIAQAYSEGVLQDDLARRYGLTQSSISRILGEQGVRLQGEALHQRLASSSHSERRTSDRQARGRPRLPLHEHERPAYEKLRRHYGAAFAREQMWVRQ